MVMAYRFFRARCCSARLGSASVISTGSGLRGRGNCWLEATDTIPPAAAGGREDPPARPWPATHGATLSAHVQAPIAGVPPALPVLQNPQCARNTPNPVVRRR